MRSRPRVLLLSGYDAASHRRWREQITILLDDYEWHSLVLPPRFFHWRIRGNALSWLNEPLLQQSWDLIVATSMVDLAGLRSFHPSLARSPCVLYMHENQFAFPVSNRQRAGVEPQMVNLYSAISADVVVFNSAWNRDSFLDGSWALLDKMPDGVPDGVVAGMAAKSEILPVPIEDRLFINSPRPVDWVVPHLVWNDRWECASVGVTLKLVWASRWEYDKGPSHLLAFLDQLEARKVDYRLCMLGERFRSSPREFETIGQRFAHRLVQFGYADSRDEYVAWLRAADVVFSSALHEFQGIAVLEAVASGCVPLVPNRQSYPELFGRAYCYESFPDDAEWEAVEAADKLEEIQNDLLAGRDLSPDITRFSTSALKPEYEALLNQMRKH